MASEEREQSIKVALGVVPTDRLLEEYIRRQNWGSMISHGHSGFEVKECEPHGATHCFEVTIDHLS